MPYYVGKHSSGVGGSQHVGLGRKITGEDTERQSCRRWRVCEQGGCSLLLLCSGKYNLMQQRPSCCQSIQPTGLPCTTPQLDQSSRELQAEGEKGSWRNHLPLGTKSQELPGTGGLSQGVTQSWDDLQEQTKTTGSTNF